MDNYINYVKGGLIWPADKKGFIAVTGGLIIFTFPAAWMGFMLGGVWKLLSIIMLSVYIIANIVVLILLCFKLTAIRRLWLQIIMTFDWVIGLLLVQSILTVSYFGFQWWMIVSYIMPIITPVLLGVIKYNEIKKRKINSKVSLGVGTSVIGGSLGFIVTMLLKDDLKALSQLDVRIIMFLLITLMHAYFSIQFLSIQRLYYVYKYKLSTVLDEGASTFIAQRHR